MTRRHIHYEAAFEDYLRSRGVPYVPVDETRRAIFAGERIKSFDFLVYPGQQRHWIVDVKGRQFPYVNEKGAKRYWENWNRPAPRPRQGGYPRFWPLYAG